MVASGYRFVLHEHFFYILEGEYHDVKIMI